MDCKAAASRAGGWGPLALLAAAAAMLLGCLLAGMLLYAHYAATPEVPLLQDDEPCRRTQCRFGAECHSERGQAYCRCRLACSDGLFAPVCGSDGFTYSSECRLRMAACIQQKHFTAARSGPCDVSDPCRERQCQWGAECRPTLDGRSADCVCPDKCVSFGDARGSRPVCGSDGRDYPNTCELRRAACTAAKEIRPRFQGPCDPCAGVECPGSQVCQLDEHRNPICRCNGACRDGGGGSGPVCGSDGRTYSSECALRVEACRSRRPLLLRLLHSGSCSLHPCTALRCGPGQECHIDRLGRAQCACPPPCEAVVRPVCAHDGNTYDSECHLRRDACLRGVSAPQIAYTGPCDTAGPCHGFQCPSGALCSANTDGTPSCHCPACPADTFDPVCGSDGISYRSECELRREACQRGHEVVNFSHVGLCRDACDDQRCPFYGVCNEGSCTCPPPCEPPVDDPVCGSDGATYRNECELRRAACEKRLHLEVSSRGPCDSCRGVECRYGATCQNGVCVCPDCDEAQDAVCGSDGRTYPSECFLRRAACEQAREDLTVLTRGDCPPEDGSGSEGSGCNSCRFGSECRGDECRCPDSPCPPAPAPVCGSDGTWYASACHLQREACLRQRELRVVGASRCEAARSCSRSPHGCCPDGATPALGPRGAGCPSVCRCNRLGALGPTCDPASAQCACKPGVGGLRCDRCQPGYWGLHRISDGVNGCSPCRCHPMGSVRDDCEQMTGRCVCKHGVRGMKCDQCPVGASIGPDGCAAGSESPHHTCEPCNQDGGGPVCGSDGQTYASACQLRQFVCRLHVNLTVDRRGACSPTAVPTAGSIRRSTAQRLAIEQSGLVPPTPPASEEDDSAKEAPWRFTGASYLELRRLQAYTGLSLEVEFEAESPEGLLLYNGQTSSGAGDFVALALREGHLEFRFDLGSGPVVLRAPRRITLGRRHRAVAKRYLRDGFLTLDDEADVRGRSRGLLQSLDLAESLFVGWVPGGPPAGVARNAGTGLGFRGCVRRLRVGKRDASPKEVLRARGVSHCCNGTGCALGCDPNPCPEGSSCMGGRPDGFSCRCGPGRSGRLCADRADVPAFSGDGYLELPRLKNVGRTFSLELWFLAESPTGLLLYNGGTSGDFLSLGLQDGRLELRYDLGSGAANISTPNVVSLGGWHTARVTRSGREGSLQLDDGPTVHGEASGPLSELNLEQPLYLGGLPWDTAARHPQGLQGALQRLVLNGEAWPDLVSRAQASERVSSFKGPPCGNSPCLHGGLCLPHLERFTCACPTGFGGTRCQLPTPVGPPPVAFDGADTRHFRLASRSPSEMETRFRTESPRGLILWTGGPRGDHLALGLSEGRLVLSFDLGARRELLTSSGPRLDDGRWHTARLILSGRDAVLTVDGSLEERATAAPGASRLDTDALLWVGGCPSLPSGLPTSLYAGFAGCLEDLRADGRPLPLVGAPCLDGENSL
ncbi:agrin-like isoform X2 [Ornithodoros turicata]|uniref:agrin-like isoform X2 n=1 Tax=Ornithodoros turicata TaxID=34597 RepID=UPI003138B000